jgi:hypothetical protein
MISKEDLLKEISGTIGKMKVLELTRILERANFDMNDLIELTFNPNRDVAFRAAWILENMFLQSPERYLDNLDTIILRLPDVEHESCQRHFVKILMHITGKKTSIPIRRKLEQTNLEPIVEQCFEWMIDPDVKIAVKCFSSEVLFNLRRRYDWIAEELANQLQFLMRDGGPGIQARGKRLLKELRQ